MLGISVCCAKTYVAWFDIASPAENSSTSLHHRRALLISSPISVPPGKTSTRNIGPLAGTKSGEWFSVTCVSPFFLSCSCPDKHVIKLGTKDERHNVDPPSANARVAAQ